MNFAISHGQPLAVCLFDDFLVFNGSLGFIWLSLPVRFNTIFSLAHGNGIIAWLAFHTHEHLLPKFLCV